MRCFGWHFIIIGQTRNALDTVYRSVLIFLHYLQDIPYVGPTRKTPPKTNKQTTSTPENSQGIEEIPLIYFNIFGGPFAHYSLTYETLPKMNPILAL